MLKRKIKSPLILTQNSPIDFPSGTVVKTEDGIFLIKGNVKIKYFSERVFDTWKLNCVLAKPKTLSNYSNGGIVGFREGTLIKNFADGKVYLISENKLRHIVSPDVWSRYGLDKNAIIEVADNEVLIHKDGNDLV